MVNEKDGEADRVVSIVPIASGDLNPDITFKAGSKSTSGGYYTFCFICYDGIHRAYTMNSARLIANRSARWAISGKTAVGSSHSMVRQDKRHARLQSSN